MYKIDTTSECGYIYINNPQGEHMSWKEVEQTLNSLTHKIDTFKAGNATLHATLQQCKQENKKLKEEIECMMDLLDMSGVQYHISDELYFILD